MIPFAAIKSFFDPSANFGVEFTPGRSSGEEAEPHKLAPAAEKIAPAAEKVPDEESGKPAAASDQC